MMLPETVEALAVIVGHQRLALRVRAYPAFALVLGSLPDHMKRHNQGQAWWQAHTFDLCKLEASLVYKMSARPPRVT